MSVTLRDKANAVRVLAVDMLVRAKDGYPGKSTEVRADVKRRIHDLAPGGGHGAPWRVRQARRGQGNLRAHSPLYPAGG